MELKQPAKQKAAISTSLVHKKCIQQKHSFVIASLALLSLYKCWTCFSMGHLTNVFTFRV